MRRILLIIAILTLLLSCQKKGMDILEVWPWEDPEEVVEPEEKPEDQQPVEDATLDKWADVSKDYGSLPSHIRVYKSPSHLEGKSAVAFIAVADLSSAGWDIWSVKSDDSYSTPDSYKTPSEVYSSGSWPVVINAGFFYHSDGTNYTSSLAVRNSEVLAYNINYASEDWKTMYYPTRAAFLELSDGSFDACWTYKTWNGHFMYPDPAANDWTKEPASQPSADYPEGAKEFAAVNGIGGGPVLINKGKFTDSYVAELFNGESGIGPDSNQPRTAIGVTSDKKMILFVCEGREMTAGVKGLTTADVANVLLDLKCVEAINLDGGGSSCMLVNGKETIKVSDGTQRSVASTVMIK
ncbi:MAG: phosphodiester glycosidase family protein [Bacteroidales bacterium]|nr:phosphodiester glycosidase family protein [Bacteroidales bacterium]